MSARRPARVSRVGGPLGERRLVRAAGASSTRSDVRLLEVMADDLVELGARSDRLSTQPAKRSCSSARSRFGIES